MADAYDFWAARLAPEEVGEVGAFWDRFVRVAVRIERYLRGEAPEVNLGQEMRMVMGPFSDRLFWAIEPSAGTGWHLVVTAELTHSLRPLARAIATRGQDLAGWSASDARLPVVEISAAVHAILDRSRSEAMAVEEIAPVRGAHRMVDLQVAGRGDADFLGDQAGVIFGVLLGDRADQDWLGEAYARRRGGPLAVLSARPRRNDRWLTEFRNAAVDIIAAFEAERPERSYAEVPLKTDELHGFRLNPMAGDAARRRDVISYQSRNRALTAAIFAGARIGTLRFSRFHEAFCGIKIRRTEAQDFRQPEAVRKIAETVEEVLMKARLGGVTAFGEGVRHVYIDLAMLQVEPAMPILRAALRRAGVEAPTWLMFDEAGLEDRYFALTPDTQPSPVA
ncbi:MAG: hypothetical protein ACFBSD_07165 [Paracoccaceae bacterium]